MDEWAEHDDNGHLISGEFSIYDDSGIWYLDKRLDYMGYVAIDQFDSLEEAKAAALALT